MKLIGYTCTYNEAEMVPYVMPYVERMGYDKFIVYDNESTDNTVELLKQYPFVEVRTYSTDGKFDEYARVDIFIKAYSEAFKMAKVGTENEEQVWLTITDFDEVLFTTHMSNFKSFLSLRHLYFKENYFSDIMINVLPKRKCDIDDLTDEKYVHLSQNAVGTLWMNWGKKTSLFLVNDFQYFETVIGHHISSLHTRDTEQECHSLSESGEIFGFHLKYINKKLKEKTHEEYHKRDNKIFAKDLTDLYDSFHTCSFNINEYCAKKQFEVIKNLDKQLSALSINDKIVQ
jgi:glycosyltransferase involved in cell wall biosynthesis